MNDALLMILNPRELDECLISLERMNCPKVWLTRFSEFQLETVIPRVISETNYDYYAIVSDDVVVSEDAYEAVLDLARKNHPVVTGYCNLDTSTPTSALTKVPFQGVNEPTEEAYKWYSLAEIRAWPDDEPIPTHFACMAFTCMSRDMWAKFPWKCWAGPPGWCADYSLAIRLRDAQVPIVAPKRGYVYHTKQIWQTTDTQTRRRINVGTFPPEIRYEL